MGTEFEDFARSNLPFAWSRSEEAQALLGVLGASLDEQIAKDRELCKIRWPVGPRMRALAEQLGVELHSAAEIGDDERLRKIGIMFGLERLPTMTAEAFEAYLENAWELHEQATTEASIKAALVAYGIPDVEILEEYEGIAAPGLDYAYRLVIVFGPDYGSLGWQPLTLPFELGSEESVLGLQGVTEQALRDIGRLVRRWKKAAALPVSFVFRFGTGTVLGFELAMPFELGGGSSGTVVEVPYGRACELGEVVLGSFALGNFYLF
jgi:hypothetical protein